MQFLSLIIMAVLTKSVAADAYYCHLNPDIYCVAEPYKTECWDSKVCRHGGCHELPVCKEIPKQLACSWEGLDCPCTCDSDYDTKSHRCKRKRGRRGRRGHRKHDHTSGTDVPDYVTTDVPDYVTTDVPDYQTTETHTTQHYGPP